MKVSCGKCRAIVFGEVDHAGDVGGIVLAVGVEGDDASAGSGLEAGVERCGLAAVASELHDAEIDASGDEGEEELCAAVGASVIDGDDFVGSAEGF